MGATFNRIKDWVAEVLTYADLNAEIDNILTNLGPAGVDDYSTNVAQMKLQTDPGSLGAESLANSLAGEIERLRYAVNRITGENFWYEAPNTNLAELSSALGGGLTENRIASGRTLSGQSQPAFLVPNGSNRTVSIQGATTPFVYYIKGVQYTISTNVTSGTLVAAPGTNNTCLVNDVTLTGQLSSKLQGEYDTVITVDAMGSEISALVGKLAGFKVGTEYFLAKVESSTQLTKAVRGWFFSSVDASFPRVTLSDNASISLMKLTWIFARADGTLTQTYNNPTASAIQPTSASIGDYWFDMTNGIWKFTLDGSTWQDANAILVGISLQDTTNTVAARSFDFFRNYSTTNNIDIERVGNTDVQGKALGEEISVYGNAVRFTADYPDWNTTTNLATETSSIVSRNVYFYLKETGEPVVSDVAPHDRRADIQGFYHPTNAWRCVGYATTNASSQLIAGTTVSFFRTKDANFFVNGFPNSATVVADSVLKNTGTGLTYWQAPTPTFHNVQRFTSGSGTYNLAYLFFINSGSATAGATYTNNGVTYTVTATVASGIQIIMTGSGAPLSSGLLTKASGTGDTTLIFNEVKAPKQLVVTLAGAGGGGAGSSGNGSGNGTAGGTGGNTTFGTSLLSATGGTGGAGLTSTLGGAGGGTTVNSPAISVIALTGGAGTNGMTTSVANVATSGGAGGQNAFGGGGAAGQGNSVAGGAAATNTGGGGGGGSSLQSAAALNYGGGGGGAGGYIRALLNGTINATYAYSVGTAGTAGTNGTNGALGGAGSAGVIIVEEYY